MSGRLVWCRLCTVRYEHLGGALPDRCPACQAEAHWSAIDVQPKDYKLSENDRRFLKAIRVEADS